MIEILTIMAPVFGIIALGYVSGRTGYLTDQTGRGIADFAFNIAIPALLFRTILLAKFDGVAPLGILASFFGAACLVWALSAVATRFMLRRPAADGPSIAMTSVFGNTVMLGLPIGVAAFGQDALAPISVILAVHAPLFLTSATLHSALVAERGGGSVGAALWGITGQLIRQPLILAILTAAVWRTTGIALPKPMLVMAEMLALAGVPAALVALGLSLRTFTIGGDRPTLALVLALKLLALPLVAGVLAVGVFQLPPLSAKVVILLAALPAGANSYLYCVKTGRAVNAASGAVALGTALSALTIAAILASNQ